MISWISCIGQAGYIHASQLNSVVPGGVLHIADQLSERAQANGLSMFRVKKDFSGQSSLGQGGHWMGRIKITDTSLRDGHQSLWATRMSTDDMSPALDMVD